MFPRFMRRLVSASALVFAASAGRCVAETDESAAVGPFWFQGTTAEGDTVRGLRPFWDEVRNEEGELVSASFLYPLWHQEVLPEAEFRRWTLFNLVNYERDEVSGLTRFDAWPFYFSRQTDQEDESDYRALFPFYGDIHQRFGQDRLTFALFPLYGRFEENEVVTTTTPWPFIKTISGGGMSGFEVWPLGGHRAADDGGFAESFALWPFYYRKRTGPAEDPATLQTGLLPFYALDRSEGYVSETYLWPFFGYVDRTAPYRYHATHYLWPLWVQGRGENRTVNRWAPFYSHSEIRGHKKTWIMWPLWRDATWRDATLQHHRRQFLYFLYHSDVQTSLHHPDAAPASKTHLWPFFSAWNNGAGRKQVQVLSPIEVFLPHNERTRRLWSPLFALYRYDENEVENRVEHRLLWSLLKWSHRREADAHAVSLGPLVTFATSPDEKRLSFFGGKLGVAFDGGLRAWTPFSDSSTAASP